MKRQAGAHTLPRPIGHLTNVPSTPTTVILVEYEAELVGYVQELAVSGKSENWALSVIAVYNSLFAVLFAFLGGLLAVYMTRERKPVTTQLENHHHDSTGGTP